MRKNIDKEFERELEKAIIRAKREILKIYEQSIVEISFSAAGVSLKDKPFSLSLYPVLNEKIESMVPKMHKKIYEQIVKSVRGAWELSNKRTDAIVDRRLAGKGPRNNKARQILYDPNLDALNAFLERKQKGLNLSRRVWKSLSTYKKELEQALGIATSNGQAAVKIASEVKKYLNNPDKLFRRVRSEEGKLVLSKRAREFHPGQGVYRSSFKNALRLTATETNIAYRTADYERWQKLPFVIGIRVRLSDNHPRFDVCDSLAGLYPKDFRFKGWHPFCICYQVPEMMNDEQYSKIEDQMLAGEPVTVPKNLLIASPPKSFTTYLAENKERMDGWKNKPYWIRDNKKYLQ